MARTINPEWKKYNDLMNEGGEGYNPHKKWVYAASESPVAAKVATASKQDIDSRFVRDQRGNLVRASAMRESMQKDIARLEKITSEAGRKITIESIEFAKQQLGI